MLPLLTRANEIWVLRPTVEDLKAAAFYASVSLPWTFNRMMANSSPASQNGRALNIAKGIVVQETLRRELECRGVKVGIQRKSHRDTDLFDFHVPIHGKMVNLDVKSLNYFTDYAGTGRAPLSSELIAANKQYPGPDWRVFFPMLVPHTQLHQDKGAYCLVITSSIDTRKDIHTDRPDYMLAAFPHGEAMQFLGSKKLCEMREAAKQGYYIRCTYVSDGSMFADRAEITIVGEWNGEVKRVPVELRPGHSSTPLGPFSCIDSFLFTKASYVSFAGSIQISVSRNDFVDPVRNSKRQNVNAAFSEPLVIEKSSICNLVLPSSYTMFVLGWVSKEDYLRDCRKYTGWVWPKDSVNRYHNQPWSQITVDDVKTITTSGFGDCIRTKPSEVRAGFMKTNGHGGGACCYVYPNIGRNGGLRETNLYVLPQDLNTMETLGKV